MLKIMFWNIFVCSLRDEKMLIQLIWTKLLPTPSITIMHPHTLTKLLRLKGRSNVVLTRTGKPVSKDIPKFSNISTASWTYPCQQTMNPLSKIRP